MGKLPILWIELRTFCHATEREERVVRALDAACPGDPPARDALEGHFGNPIVRLTRRLDRGAAIREAWGLWDRSGIVAALAPDASDRVDEDGVLHFRLDKQSAYGGSLALAKDADSIDVRVRLEAFPATPDRFRAVGASLARGGR